MKVIMTKENMAEYKQLFADFNQYIKDNGGDAEYANISDLVTYFRALHYCIKELKATPPFKYYRVPLDGPVFKVDMDARSISVPPKFTQYGLGVQGDVNAEIVIFKIERLYELMDLDLLVKDKPGGCWVQWSHSNGKVSGNSEVILSDVYDEEEDVLDANGNPMFDEEGVKITVRNPYIYAAWIIDEKIASASSNVDFALRFFSLSDSAEVDVNGQPKKYISYSVSTQKASCPIKPSLNLPVLGDIVADNLQQLVLSRPIYSGVINSMNGASPRITTNLVAGTYDLSTETAEAALYNEAFPNGVFKLAVEAESPDGKTVLYQWYSGRDLLYDPLNNDSYDESLAPEKKFGDLAQSKVYYATTAGSYFCKIGNYDKSSGTRWIDSAAIEIPKATEIKIHSDKLLYSFPIKTYSITQDTGTIKARKLQFAVEGANGDVKYDWYLTDLAGNDIPKNEYSKYGTMTDNGEFIPVVGMECIVSAKATNHKNNTVSATIEALNASGNTCTYRAMPVAPDSVSLSFQGNVLTAIPNFPNNSASGNTLHKNEWNYEWAFSSGGSTDNVSPTYLSKDAQTGYGKMSAVLNQFLQKPTDGTSYKVYRIWCNANHIVYEDDNALRVTGNSTASNTIELWVYADGTIVDKSKQVGN